LYFPFTCLTFSTPVTYYFSQVSVIAHKFSSKQAKCLNHQKLDARKVHIQKFAGGLKIVMLSLQFLFIDFSVWNLFDKVTYIL
jgi:hypothetical protein